MESRVLHLFVLLVASALLKSVHQAEASDELCGCVVSTGDGCEGFASELGRDVCYSEGRSTIGLYPEDTTATFTCQEGLTKVPSSSQIRCDGNEWTGEAFCTINIALNKPASQSSNYRSDEIPGRVVDGNQDSNLHHRSCTETKSGRGDEWISVDLGGLYKIGLIRVYNRQDCCDGRLNGAKVLIGCGQCEVPLAQTLNANAVQDIPLDWVIGRNVTILLENAAAQLHICELEVYGIPLDN